MSLEGRSFQRFTASQVAAGASFEVARSGVVGNAGRAGAARGGGDRRGVRHRGRASRAGRSGAVRGRRGPATATLAREIAALDHVYAAPARQAGSGGEHYRARRAALVGQLVEAQAVEDREPARIGSPAQFM